MCMHLTGVINVSKFCRFAFLCPVTRIMGPALIKGVLLDHHLLLRLSTGKRHVMRAMTRKDLVDPNSHHTNPSRSKLTPLSHEEALERHIRLELLGVPRGKEGGRDPAPHEKKGRMD